MRRLKLFTILIFIISSRLVAQTTDELLAGVVSFKNASNVYVRFASTAKINIGDTLLIKSTGKMIPCLVVIAKSSISCVTTPLKGFDLDPNTPIYFKVKPSNDLKQNTKTQDSIPVVDTTKLKTLPVTIDTVKTKSAKKELKQHLYGRITMASYSTFSATNSSSLHSLTGRVSLSIDHINNSKWSLETYLNYRQNVSSEQKPSGYKTWFFNVYDLSLKYEPSKNLTLSLGRRINNKMASIGAIDGIQADYQLKRFFIGAIAGSRPDIYTYGYNPNLMEFGVYGGFGSNNPKLSHETTLGILEQRKGAATDRRYAYWQHTNRLTSKLSMFSSLELDLYQQLNGVAQLKPRLTSFYYSLNYQFNNKLSMMASYDSRRNIIYYETFIGNEIDRLLADDLNRQGIRFRLNYKLTKRIYSGFSFSNRFQADGQNKSTNFYGFISHSKIPWIGGNLNLSANLNSSNYLQSKILALNYSRNILKDKAGFSLYYRVVDYTYISRQTNAGLQHYIGSDFSTNLKRNFSFHTMLEWSVKGADNNLRLNLNLTKRIR